MKKQKPTTERGEDTALRGEELIKLRKERAEKTKNRILAELYQSEKKMSVYRICKKIEGVSNSSVREQVLDLEVTKAIKIERVKKGNRDTDLVELTPSTREKIEKDEGILARDIVMYYRKQLTSFSLDNTKNIDLLNNKTFLKTLSKMRELGVISDINIKYTEKGKKLLGL